jgi:nucleotide-binding universal stress UspA family protein
MKTIIVPLDFSNESLNGLNLAMMMAHKTGASIKLIYVIGNYESTATDQIEKDREIAKLKFEELIKKYREKSNEKIEMTYAIKVGKIFKETADLADTLEDVLTVLSTHGESGFEELFIGGHAYKIISHSRNPVISMRGSRLPANIDKIVMPLDITFKTREKVPYTVELAKLFNSKIHLITITTTKAKSIVEKLHQYADQVSKYIEYQKISYTIEHLQGENLTDISLDYANSVKADLISIMTEQEKSISNLLLGSYAHQMINKAFIPVLSFPNYHLRIVSDDIWSLGAFDA